MSGHGGGSAPELGAGGRPAPTLLGLAALLWGHAKPMAEDRRARGVPAPGLSGQDLADILAFLGQQSHASDGGSALIGGTLFAERGCAGCHGSDGLGGPGAPGLRGRGNPASAITLARAFLLHGPAMAKAVGEARAQWPHLAASEIGDLVAWVNAPPGVRR